MHDVIRDMAIWIAKKKDYVLVIEETAINDRQMTEWEKAKRISLRNVGSFDSYCSRTYSNLSTLLVSSYSAHFRISTITFPRGFFQCMPVIKVLDFEECLLEHVQVEIGNLVSLQHLGFSSTRIKTWPIDLKNLTNLRSLCLERSCFLMSIPRGVTSGLSMLQVFRIAGTKMNIVDNNLSGHEKSLLEEVECLQSKDYANLSIQTIHDVRNLTKLP